MTDLDGPIIEGQRAGQVKLGLTRDACTELFGRPIQKSKYDDCTFLAWPIGLQLRFNRRDKVTNIFCYFTVEELRRTLAVGNSQDWSTVDVTPCTLVTDRGVSGRSREGDVREAYGEPKKAFGGDPEEWSRLEYPGIDFRFVHDTLVRVSISRTRKKK